VNCLGELERRIRLIADTTKDLLKEHGEFPIMPMHDVLGWIAEAKKEFPELKLESPPKDFSDDLLSWKYVMVAKLCELESWFTKWFGE